MNYFKTALSTEESYNRLKTLIKFYRLRDCPNAIKLTTETIESMVAEGHSDDAIVKRLRKEFVEKILPSSEYLNANAGVVDATQSINTLKNADIKRIKNRVKQISRMLPKKESFKPKSYLDIGVLDGSITKAVGSYYNLKPSQIHGTEIHKPEVMPKDFQLTIVDESHKLPYPDNSFDFITSLMILHHEKNYKELIKEIYRVLRPGGFFVMREHDCISETVAAVINIMHYFYMSVWDIEDRSMDTSEYYFGCHTRQDMDNAALSAGFYKFREDFSLMNKRNKSDFSNPDTIYNLAETYTDCFKKPLGNSKRNKNNGPGNNYRRYHKKSFNASMNTKTKNPTTGAYDVSKSVYTSRYNTKIKYDNETLDESLNTILGKSIADDSSCNIIAPVDAIKTGAGSSKRRNKQSQSTSYNGGKGRPSNLHDYKSTDFYKKVHSRITPQKVTECALVVTARENPEVCSTEGMANKMAEFSGASKELSKEEKVSAAIAVTNCDSERCVLEHPEFQKFAGLAKISQELEMRYKVNGKTDVSLLSNFDIDKTLLQWRILYRDFHPYNFNMRDWKSHGDTLETKSVADLYTSGFRTAACVINNDYYSGRGTHWMALFVDMRKLPYTIEYFNSSGNPPKKEFVEWLDKSEAELIGMLVTNGMMKTTTNDNSKYVKKVVVSNIQHQKSRTECGVYSLYYIWARLASVDYKLFSDYYADDALMFEMRQHLFNDKKNKSHVTNGKFDIGKYESGTNIEWE